MIAYLQDKTEDQYADELADCIMSPWPEGVESFRSPALIARSVAAAQYLINDVNSAIRRRGEDAGSNKDKHRAREAFRNKVGRERAILESILREEELRRGIIRNSPNASARASRRLKQRHLAEYQELKREEEAKIVEEKRAAKRAAREAAKAQDRAERGLSPR